MGPTRKASIGVAYSSVGGGKQLNRGGGGRRRPRHAEGPGGDGEGKNPPRHNRRSENGRGGRNGSSGDSRGGPHNSAEDGRTPATEFQVACDGGADKSGS